MFITQFHHILGFLSDSYIVEVTYSMKYREDDADHSVESWFVKVIIMFLIEMSLLHYQMILICHCTWYFK